MKDVIAFLKELQQNNNKTWFDQNKTRYQELRGKFNSFGEKLIAGIARFDPSVADVPIKDAVYRIYRDVRFSKDKTPYKTHMGVYVCPRGKTSGYAGYYFHIEPSSANHQGGHLLAAGLHCPEPKILSSVRYEIFDNPNGFLKTLKKAKGFELDGSSMLKRIPAGYPADFPYAEYLKYKDYTLVKNISEADLLSNGLLEYCLEEFKKTADFNRLLNKAVEFALEEGA